MATLVARATLLPLTEIDALEFSLDDAPHFLSIVRGDAAGKVGERERLFLGRHREGDLPVFRDPFRALERPEDAILVHGLDHFLHRNYRIRPSRTAPNNFQSMKPDSLELVWPQHVPKQWPKNQRK